MSRSCCGTVANLSQIGRTSIPPQSRSLVPLSVMQRYFMCRCTANQRSKRAMIVRNAHHSRLLDRF
eukprot:4035083-Amphidinium_carterae.1